MTNLEEQVRIVFRNGIQDNFMDGYYTGFHHSLIELTKEHGEQAIAAIIAVIRQLADNKQYGEVVRQGLIWVCDEYIKELWQERRQLACDMLFSDVYLVADGALLAIDALDDPAALPCVERRLAQEMKDTMFKRDLELTANYLRGRL